MKKIYKKPSLVVESFVTEEVMDNENLLSELTNDMYGLDSFGTNNSISFRNGDSNVLNGINYLDFAN